jgi:hypothetical protein
MKTLRIACTIAAVVSKACITHQYCFHLEQSTLVFCPLEDANEIVYFFVSFTYRLSSYDIAYVNRRKRTNYVFFLYLGYLIASPVSY